MSYTFLYNYNTLTNDMSYNKKLNKKNEKFAFETHVDK